LLIPNLHNEASMWQTEAKVTSVTASKSWDSLTLDATMLHIAMCHIKWHS